MTTPPMQYLTFYFVDDTTLQVYIPVTLANSYAYAFKQYVDLGGNGSPYLSVAGTPGTVATRINLAHVCRVEGVA